MTIVLSVAIAVGDETARREETIKRAAIPKEAIQALKGFQLAPGFEADLYAAEPLVMNPVAFTFDDHGRCLVCETYRQEQGVEDNRQHEDWIDDDLQSQTVEDRKAMFEKHAKGDLSRFTSQEDRIRMLVDRNQDGRADRATVYVGGFNDILAGTGAGVLSAQDNVYYTCIPHLWAFRDDDNDGKADRRASLHEGFGVRVALRGHDLHGLIQGPDGRIYFSIGDRGYHVKTEDGLLSNPASGAIFRCELDGSGLEVFATGFRNPQELAFDELGNLFTGDNNSDGGDRARWVHVLEGMDAGWRMHFQYLPTRGPWNREAMWQPLHVGQPAFIYPPIANVADGPAGLAYYPGTGLSPAYAGNFFLCDFRGTPAVSGLRSFKVQPVGGTFRMLDPEVILWKCLVTDVAFGPDGGLYVSDWVEGWEGERKGRIYRLFDPKVQTDEAELLAEVRSLLASGLKDLKLAEVLKLMEHADLRLRQRAQFEIARRGSVAGFAAVLTKSGLQVARLHATWGLGQLARRGGTTLRRKALTVLEPLLRDADPEIRVAAVTVLGDAKVATAGGSIVALLSDPSSRVRVAAAIASGKMRLERAAVPLARLLNTNGGVDPALRHAGIFGLTGCASDADVLSLKGHPSEHVRLAAVVALRRSKSPLVAKFLEDDQELVVAEAARAIYDEPLPEAYTALAETIDTKFSSLPLLERTLMANHRLGGSSQATAIAKFAADNNRPLPMRQFALTLLASWEHSGGRDLLLGEWRPLPEDRDGDAAAVALRDALPDLIDSGQEIRYQATQIAAQLGIREAADELVAVVEDQNRDGRERAGALLSLGTLRPANLRNIVEESLRDDADRVRAAARMVLTDLDPFAAVKELSTALETGTQIEQQAATEMLARAANAEADQLLLRQMELLHDTGLAPPIQLDTLNAARRRGKENEQLQAAVEKYDASRDANDPLSAHRVSLEGGDAERGRRIFFERLSVACSRCHRVEDQGGEVGPDLTHIGRDKSREELLESMVDPNASITKGFETLVLTTESGRVVSGILQVKTKKRIQLLTGDGELVTVNRSEIEDLAKGASSMPSDIVHLLSPYDLRDLVEYLAELK